VLHWHWCNRNNIDLSTPLLSGKRGLVVGIANEHHIAVVCARAFRAAGAELALTYLSDRSKAYVAPIASDVAPPIFTPVGTEAPGQMEAVFDAMDAEWGTLNFLLHSLTLLAIPLMRNGGSILTMSYHVTGKVVDAEPRDNRGHRQCGRWPYR
jgi:enoyl-[acyl-carrier protein] reductase I